MRKLLVDESACVSEHKSEIMCKDCIRNIDLADACINQAFSDFTIKPVKNFKTGADTKCDGFLDV